MIGKYNQATFTPTVDVAFRAASGGADVFWDWQPMEIPKGTCAVKSISGTIVGVDGAVGNGLDMGIYFATSIDGIAPATFGTAHAVNTATITATFRRNILGFQYLDMSSIDDLDALRGYHVVGARSAASNDLQADGGINQYQFLQAEDAPFAGNATYSATTPGYQTIWVAAMTAGAAFSFSTEVDLNMAGHQAASTAAVQITTSGTDPRTVFQPGDLIKGHTDTVTAEVVSVDSATLMTVKDVSAQIDHGEELLFQKPIKLLFGLEY